MSIVRSKVINVSMQNGPISKKFYTSHVFNYFERGEGVTGHFSSTVITATDHS